MGWLDDVMPHCDLTCAYCSIQGKFPHARSYVHCGDTLSLYRCFSCGSLIYDLQGIAAPLVSASDEVCAEAARAARYVVEAGFSSRHVALGGLCAVPETNAARRSNLLFVDVGAGLGLASYFVREVLGVECLTIEPSFTGGLAAQILDCHVHRAYFEDLPPEVINVLAERSCLLHLNSVIEHLVSPRAVLQQMMSCARVERIAITVPDGGTLDLQQTFTSALPFLAPRDHRHLPSQKGLRTLLKKLGFRYVLIQREPGQLVATASNDPIAMPSGRTVQLAETLLLERMMRHPQREMRLGGASRLVAAAVLGRDTKLLTELRAMLDIEIGPERWLYFLKAGLWDQIPYYLGPTCYWLAYEAFLGGRRDDALALLSISEAFADRIAADEPSMAMTPLMFKWSALLLRATVLLEAGDPAGSAAVLRRVIDAQSDRRNGPAQTFIEQANTALQKFDNRIAEAA